MSNTVRAPAVAGMFYPANAGELSTMVRGFLAGVEAGGPPPKAIIVPHAGYIYSGPVAASAYALIAPLRHRIKRVVLLGPSHRVPLRGLAAPSVQQFSTPLGNVPLDRPAIDALLALPQVSLGDDAHALEHSLEVHLPFLQTVLADFALVPLVVGQTAPQQMAKVLEALWDGDETLIVISTDLSHYHSHGEAVRLDRATCDAIEHLAYERIHGEDACGCHPLNGLLYLARQRGLEVRVLDLRNSGDTAGPRDQVVGYGAFAVREADHA